VATPSTNPRHPGRIIVIVMLTIIAAVVGIALYNFFDVRASKELRTVAVRQFSGPDTLSDYLREQLSTMRTIKVMKRGETPSNGGTLVDGLIVPNPGGNVRVTLQLTNQRTGMRVWAKSFDGPAAESPAFRKQMLDELAIALTRR
jgi:hypothetical protein